MNRYKIVYINKKGEKIEKISIGKTAIEAVEKYGHRPVFGGNSIFFNTQLKTCDAETYGINGCSAIADNGIIIDADIIN